MRRDRLKVVPELLGYCGRLRAEAGIDRRLIVERLPFPVTMGRIERWETGGAQPAAGQLDEVVNIYARLCNVTAAGIWAWAVTEAATLPGVMGCTFPGEVALTVNRATGEVRTFTSDGEL